MSFSAMVDQLKGVKFDELRQQYDGYFEFVVPSQKLNELYPILENFFGVPFKPAGIEPSNDHSDIAKRYGGVQKQQTLYYIERGGQSTCAMIWPWSSGSRATVKLAQGLPGKK